METVRVPEQTLTVVPSVQDRHQPALLFEPYKAISEKAEAQAPSRQPQNTLWMWTSLCLALGWIATLAIWFFSRRQSLKKGPENKPVIKFDNKTLKKACMNNNPIAAKDTLVQWGRQQWKESSLGKIALYCDDALKEEILRLNRALYSPEPSAWKGNKLLEAFNGFEKTQGKKQKVREEALQSLYKV